MVLTSRVGRERVFALEFLLYIVTFGLYGIYWHHQVHNEVYRQFELDEDRRPPGTLWLLYSRVFFPLLWAYQFVFASNVHHVRHRMGFRRNMSGGTFIGLTIPGGVLFLAGSVLLIFSLDAAVVALADLETLQELGAPDADQDAAGRLATVLAAVGIPLFMVGATLQIIAYARLQVHVNALWRAYDHRMRDFMPPADSAPPPIGTMAAPTAPRPPSGTSPPSG